MPRFLALDLETRSVVDLKKTGVYPYAAHPDTDVWCAAYALDDGPVQVWFAGERLPDDLRAALEDPRVYVRAWNAQFERILMRDVLTPRHGWPAVPLERFVCTMVAGRAAGLPGSLEEAAIALKLAEQKDMAGSRLMMQMAKPRRVEPDGTLVWWTEPVKLERLARYCAQDVATERAVFKALPPSLDRRERAIWLADQRINDRGIRLDLELIAAMRDRARQETGRLNAELTGLTSGVASVTAVARLKDWIAMRTGAAVGDLDKAAIDALLETDLPDDVRRALEIRRTAAKSSVTKLVAMERAAGDDGRVRGLLQYYGAGTGRWAGRLVQPQNFPRGEVKITPATIEALRTGAPLETDPLETISSALRGCLVADPGTALFVADYAQIEARVVAWLAGQTDLLELFASGGKVYETMAATIYGVPVETIGKDDPRRQLGKMAILGCGFQMGAERFAEQAGVDVDLARTAVEAYRTKNARIKGLWWSLQDTAIRAVERGAKAPVPVPGTDGKLSFRVHGDWLAMGLPSGRSLWYYGPRITMRPVPWDDEPKPAVMIETVNGFTRKWETQTMYGGLWTENATQAVARDLMADAILRLEAAGFAVRLTVHDEVIATASPTRSVEEFVALLSEVPRWAAGCPVVAEGWTGDRYRK